MDKDSGYIFEPTTIDKLPYFNFSKEAIASYPDDFKIISSIVSRLMETIVRNAVDRPGEAALCFDDNGYIRPEIYLGLFSQIAESETTSKDLMPCIASLTYLMTSFLFGETGFRVSATNFNNIKLYVKGNVGVSVCLSSEIAGTISFCATNQKQLEHNRVKRYKMTTYYHTFENTKEITPLVIYLFYRFTIRHTGIPDAWAAKLQNDLMTILEPLAPHIKTNFKALLDAPPIEKLESQITNLIRDVNRFIEIDEIVAKSKEDKEDKA